jgi:hypothetical protein
MTINCIFEEPWWLDAVAPEQWSSVIVKQDQEILARMPFGIKQQYGFTILSHPNFTHTLGPWLKPSGGKYATQLADQKKLMTQLIEQLPHYDLFVANFHYSLQNWLPFYWHGFSQTTKYTYLLENLEDLDRIWADFRENIRREIRKAQKQLAIRTDLDVERFWEINALTFQRQGKRPPYPAEVVYRLDKACLERDARRIFFAEDAQGRVHAVLYIVWNQFSAYYLMGGSDPELRNSGAASLLMWEAIQFAAKVSQKFDFHGSMIEPIEQFVRAFGAKQTPYLMVKGMSRRMKVLMACRDMVRSGNIHNL